MTENKMHAGKLIRVLVADEHPVVRIGVDNLLQHEAGIEIAGEAGNGNEAIARTLELHPDVLLLDLHLPGLPSLEAMRAVVNCSRTTSTILLTEAISRQEIVEGLQVGARGIVMKDAIMDCLSPAVRAVSAGSYWVGDRPLSGLVQALHQASRELASAEKKAPALTPRELEVVVSVVRGSSNRDIAQQFQLSEETVKRHLSNIFEKTGVSTRLELAIFAIEHQLVSLPA